MRLPAGPARFLLPEKKIDLARWAVIACDQHTSDPSYWEALAQFTAGHKSALNLIFPEVYLNCGDAGERTRAIVRAMNEYLDGGIFCTYEGMVSVARKVSNGLTRKGLLICVDLEDYSFRKGEKPLIRASEGTVLERIPPRVAVREKCALELPHIMLLYDDPQFSVQKAADASMQTPLYDFELNMGGGHIRGALIRDCGKVLDAFRELLAQSEVRYGEPMLFAVGDGNHSLAAAKQVYENEKSAGCGEACRYALCEAVNLYDEALAFEPIHRLVFTGEPARFSAELLKNMPDDPIEAVAYTDDFIKAAGFAADYIHGTEHLEKLAARNAAAPVVLKPINKSGFFPYLIQNGSLPKKTFSMGEAQDKRYYLEAARIK